MKKLILAIFLLFIGCSSRYILTDDVKDVTSMGYHIIKVDTLKNGFFDVKVKK